jgi:hypothetical protein
VPIQPSLSHEQQWEKLSHWLDETIESVKRGDLHRLPKDFTGVRGEAAIAAYETVKQAIHILENWETMGLPSLSAESSE